MQHLPWLVSPLALALIAGVLLVCRGSPFAGSAAEVVQVVFAEDGPAVFGIPAREPPGGRGFVLRGSGGPRPLQWRALTEPVAGRRWFLFRTDGPAGRCVLRVEPAPGRASSRARRLESEERVELEPFPQPESLGFARLHAEVVEDGPVARVVNAFYRRGQLAWGVRVTRFRRGGAEISFALSVYEGATKEPLSLSLQMTGPLLSGRDQRGDSLGSRGGQVLWVQARARGQRGFRAAGESACADLIGEGEELSAAETSRFDFQVADAAAPPPPPDRCSHVSFPPAFWRGAGLLPRAAGAAGPPARAALVEAAARALGAREEGAHFGNFRRRAGVWTNLEFDTALALLRLEMAGGPRWLLRGALDAAVCWSTRLLAAPGETGAGVTPGLPFVHGSRARSGIGEVGHAWTEGALLAGLRTGDPMLLHAARTAGDALARRVLDPTGIEDLARNLGWPLMQLEAMLVQDPRGILGRAADALGARLLARFDRKLRVFRFEEGEKRQGEYVERVWITGGILIPALRRHHARRGGAEMLAVLRAAEAAHARRSVMPDGSARSHLWIDAATGAPRGPGAACRHARALFVLEGCAPGAAGAAARSLLGRALADPIDGTSEDLATELTMAARLDVTMR